MAIRIEGRSVVADPIIVRATAEFVVTSRVAVPVTVRFVADVQSMIVPVAGNEIVPEPVAHVRVVDPVDTNRPRVHVTELTSNVPLVSVTALVTPMINVSASCNVPPAPLIVIGQSVVLPALVQVAVPDVPTYVHTAAPAV